MGAPLRLGVTGTALFLFGAIFGFWGFDKFLSHSISQTVQLVKGNEMRDNWATFPVALEFKVYLFNLTNPEEVASGGKPKVQEIGPYFFEEWKSKGNFEDDDSADEVTFKMKAVWYFMKERSEGLTGDELITIPHPVLFSMVTMVETTKPGALPMLAKALPALFNNLSSPFISARAMDILFDGIPINCSSKDFGPKAVCTLINADPKGLVKVSSALFLFSFFGPKNDTLEAGKYTVKRGVNDPKEVGLVVKYKGKSKLDTWPDDKCNILTGTDGTIFPPFIKDTDDIVSFAPDLCRSLGAKFRYKINYKGVPGNHYTADLGDNNNPDEKCYCPSPSKCMKKGAFDISKCAGAPIVLTLPHYYLADSSYLDEVEGLSPDEEKHKIFLNFEPLTGTPLGARKRLQFNIKSHAIKKIPFMKGLPNTMIPTMWIEEGLELDQKFIDILNAQLFRVINIVGVMKWVLMLIGIGMIGGGVGLHMMRKQKGPFAKAPTPQAPPTSGRF